MCEHDDKASVCVTPETNVAKALNHSGLAASIGAVIYRYVDAYDREEDIGEPDFDECWSLQQICNVIAKRVCAVITERVVLVVQSGGR